MKGRLDELNTCTVYFCSCHIHTAAEELIVFFWVSPFFFFSFFFKFPQLLSLLIHALEYIHEELSSPWKQDAYS